MRGDQCEPASWRHTKGSASRAFFPLFDAELSFILEFSPPIRQLFLSINRNHPGKRMSGESHEGYKKLVNVVTKGRDQVKQLRDAASGVNQGIALDKMLSSYEEALSILGELMSRPEDTEDRLDHIFTHEIPPKRRRRENEDTVLVAASELSCADDGYSWRKYGQKEILNSRSPRLYFRCVYRHSQGCMATKTIQKINDVPGEFRIVYRSLHTCTTPTPAPLRHA